MLGTVASVAHPHPIRNRLHMERERHSLKSALFHLSCPAMTEHGILDLEGRDGRLVKCLEVDPTQSTLAQIMVRDGHMLRIAGTVAPGAIPNRDQVNASRPGRHGE